MTRGEMKLRSLPSRLCVNIQRERLVEILTAPGGVGQKADHLMDYFEEMITKAEVKKR